MGISKVVGIASAILFISSYSLKKAGITLLTIPLNYIFFISFTITIASHNSINDPLILGKNPKTGLFPLWSKLLFGPFLVISQLYVFFKRIKRKDEPLYNEIHQGLYLGGWPRSRNEMPGGELSVVDCTCELPNLGFVGTDDYLCIGAWDTRAPVPKQIEFAVKWACAKRQMGRRIYIHCAFGHGRSACVMCALLVGLGLAESWKDAEKIVREKRKIKMNRLHRKTLEEWSSNRASLYNLGNGKEHHG
ncbi:hypothetical protein LUZ60_007415 [Juncus effusus]|nr:hypothetical protein LUZ60_007415 [Juncus effusus]